MTFRLDKPTKSNKSTRKLFAPVLFAIRWDCASLHLISLDLIVRLSPIETNQTDSREKQEDRIICPRLIGSFSRQTIIRRIVGLPSRKHKHSSDVDRPEDRCFVVDLFEQMSSRSRRHWKIRFDQSANDRFIETVIHCSTVRSELIAKRFVGC